MADQSSSMSDQGDRVAVIEHNSPEYHAAHLAFFRSEIVTAAARGEPILDRLKAYTEDVTKAETDRLRGAVEALREIATGGHAARFLMASGRTAEQVAREALVTLARRSGG